MQRGEHEEHMLSSSSRCGLTVTGSSRFWSFWTDRTTATCFPQGGGCRVLNLPEPPLQEPPAGSRAAHGHHRGLVLAGAGLCDASGAWAHGPPTSAGCSISRTKQLQHQYPWQNSSLSSAHSWCCKLGVHLASCTVQVQTNDQKRLCRFQFLFIDSAWVSPKHRVSAFQHICWKYLLHLLFLPREGFWCTYSLPCNYNVH